MNRSHRWKSAVHSWVETFSRYANGVRAINGSLTFAPTPLALGLNLQTIQDVVKLQPRLEPDRTGGQGEIGVMR